MFIPLIFNGGDSTEKKFIVSNALCSNLRVYILLLKRKRPHYAALDLIFLIAD